MANEIIEAKGSAVAGSGKLESGSPYLRLLEMAATAGNVEGLERMMALQERWEANEARKAFGEAFAAFQAECPVMVRNKAVPDKQGNVKYKYAPLEDLQGHAGPHLAKHGLSVSFDTSVDKAGCKIMCIVHHVSGHSRSTEFYAPTPDILYANDAQKAGGAMSYAMRQSYRAALGLRIVGEDDDAASLSKPVETVSDEQAANLATAADELSPDDAARLLKWAGGATWSEVPAAKYASAIAAIERKRAES